MAVRGTTSKRHTCRAMTYTHHPPPDNDLGTSAQAARSLNMLHNRWVATLNCLEYLTRRHPRATTHAYKYATASTHAMKHLRDLRSLYDNALGAKRSYNALVTTRVRDKMHITRTHHHWQQYLSHLAEAYCTTKREALTLHMDNATTVGVYNQY